MAENQLKIPKNLITNGLDSIDVLILNKLYDKTYGWEKRQSLSQQEKKELEDLSVNKWKREGASITTLHTEINKELKELGEKTEISRTEIERRIKILYEKGIILRHHAVIINPTKLFDHIFHVYLKIPISSPLRTAITRESFSWWEAISKIWETDKNETDRKGKVFDMVRMLGTIEGTGEYDVILLVYTNDIERFSELLKKLTDMNYIEKSMTQRIWGPTGMKFNPIKIPDFFEYKKAISKIKNFIKDM